MTTLHILNKSPGCTATAERCLTLATKTDSVLLIEDAVYYGLPAAFTKLVTLNTSHSKIFALEEDLVARGINTLIDDSIIIVSYDGFVELTESLQKSASWY